jgi:DedD protein
VAEPAPIAAIEAEPTARLAVQVGAFGDAASAEKLAGTLRRKGFPAFVSPSTGDSGARWRVRVGPMTSRDDADRAAARLKTEERLPTWVIEEGRS